eukprot:154327-Amphidinium_carterae.1
MCVELENLKAALSDVIKKSRNKGVSMSENAWTRTPPTGLTDFISQVDASKAKSMTYDDFPATRLDSDRCCNF